MLSPLAIGAWAGLIVLMGIGVAVWLLVAYTGGDTEANRVQLDAVRTAGTVVVGIGGAAALLLAARRQRSTEISLKQKDREQADAARAYALQERVADDTRLHQERVASATEADAEARRITDLYTKAVEQLGSDKAPVRLGGMYALERLAQDNPSQRQTIVNVWCAYLRMPYTLPGDSPSESADEHVNAKYRERLQEQEVRMAAQRVLATHLSPAAARASGLETYWPDTDIDLTNATLIGFDFSDCQLRSAIFARVEFVGDTSFVGAKFAGRADFRRAEFSGEATFDGVHFTRNVSFSGAQFVRDAWFLGTEFADKGIFGGSSFAGARFNGSASFEQASFAGYSSFNEVRFAGTALFADVQFAGSTGFSNVQFLGEVEFDHAVFSDGTPPELATFAGRQASEDGDDEPPK